MDVLNDPDLHWSHFSGSPRFDYPIDYWGAILHVGDDGHLDFAYRWAPNSFCHFHRHLCADFNKSWNDLSRRSLRGQRRSKHIRLLPK